MTNDEEQTYYTLKIDANRYISISAQLFDYFPANDIWKEIVDFSMDPDGYAPGVWIDVKGRK